LDIDTHTLLSQPLCDKLRKFVLGLDIEADARMLSERLNLDQQAIDFFRASNSLLQAGVRAGLSLYDIAILCCRNDNLGEVPSALEKLVDMASELAHIAIENERWDHAAASRAIVDQLSPQKIPRSASTFTRLSSAGSKSFCDSSGGDKSLSEIQKELDEDAPDSPAMAQSSASDSSFEEPNDIIAEKDECEEWAASVILDVSVDQILPYPPSRRNLRSESISSECSSNSYNLSSSPKGFWHTRPGSPSLADDDISLSTFGSPHNSMCSGPPPDFIPSPVYIGEVVDFKAASTVSFALPNIAAPGPYIAPRLSFKPQDNKEVPVVPMLPPPMRADSFGRSKSYSALNHAASDISSSDAPSKGRAPLGPGGRRASVAGGGFSGYGDNYRRYFHKFIDLVIVRETTAASNNSRHGMLNNL
jgi:hypothetical protein